MHHLGHNKPLNSLSYILSKQKAYTIHYTQFSLHFLRTRRDSAHYKTTVKATPAPSSDRSITTMSLLDKKFGTMFRWFDQNGDGYVDQDDLDKLTAMWTSVASESDHKNRGAIKKGLSVWEDILFGAGENKDGGKVGEQEFIHIMHTVVTRPENFEKAIMNIVNGVMGALDHDGNGNLSLEEYVSMYDAIGIPPTRSSEAFQQIDRDGSGEISPAELKEAIREYYLSDDPDARGNWLLGPMELEEGRQHLVSHLAT